MADSSGRRGIGRGHRPREQMAPGRGNEQAEAGMRGSVGGGDEMMPGRGRGGRGVGPQSGQPRIPRSGDSSSGKQASGAHRVASLSPSGSSPSPDRNLEMALKKMELTELAKRPGFGAIGRRINLIANHFELRFQSSKIITLNHYHIDISHPRLKLTRDENRILFWHAVKSNSGIFPNIFGIAFDGSHQCFTIADVKFPNNDQMYKFDLETKLSRRQTESGGSAVSESRNGRARSAFSAHGRLDGSFYDSDSTRRFWQGPGILSVTTRTRYPTAAAVNLEGGREIWHGMFTSAHVCQSYNLMVDIDVSHAAFIKPVNVVQFLIDILNANSSGGYRMEQLTASVELNDIERKVFEKEIKGLRVRVTHREDSVRKFRVNAVPGSATSMHFDVDEGQRVSVAQYFNERYGQLHFPKLPVLQIIYHTTSMKDHKEFDIELAPPATPIKNAILLCLSE